METNHTEAQSVVTGAFIAGAAPTASATKLPGGHPLLSTARADTHTLAIDTTHAVFVSSDSGRTWSAVHAPWSGQPVRVESLRQNPAPATSPQTWSRLASPVQLGAATRANAPVAGIPQAAAHPAAAAPVSITGTVSDATGANLPGTLITLRDPENSQANPSLRTTRADATGNFVLRGIAPGRYTIEAAAPGFATVSVALAVKPDTPSTATLHLQPAAESETVTVDAASAMLDTAPAAPSLRRAKRSPNVTGNPLTAQVPNLFIVTTDTGERWTSPDGVHWARQ